MNSIMKVMVKELLIVVQVALFVCPVWGADMGLQGSVKVTGNLQAQSFSGSGAGLTGMTSVNFSSLTTDQMPDNVVTTVKLSDGAVTAGKIAFYTRVSVVSAAGGDYDNPATAMGSCSTWCGTPSETNRCLLKVMPGVYDLGSSPVNMRPYIDIEGSGENTTIIQGGNGSSGTVNGANNAEIRFLTVINSGGGTNSIALYNGSASPMITNVTAVASGGDYTYGVSSFYSSPVLTNVTAMASSSNFSVGISNYQSSPVMSHVTASGSGEGINRGVQNEYSSSPVMTNVVATASGGGNSINFGVTNTHSSSPLMTNVTASASGGIISEGVNNYTIYATPSTEPVMNNVVVAASGANTSRGVNNGWNCKAKINNSIIKGSTVSLLNTSGGSVYIGNTQLDGAVTNGGTMTCLGAYTANFTALHCP